MPAQHVRRRARRAAMCLTGLAVVLGLAGCSGEGFCGANQIISFVFCRADADSSAAPPGYTIPGAPQAPQQAPSAEIRPSAYVVTIVQSVGFDGSWGDSDGHVTKFEWDLDGDGVYEIHGTPAPNNRDHRSRMFTQFGDHMVRLRVTDDDGLT